MTGLSAARLAATRSSGSSPLISIRGRARQVAPPGSRGTYQISQPGNRRSSSRRRSPCPTLSPLRHEPRRAAARHGVPAARALRSRRHKPPRTHHLPAALHGSARLRPRRTDAGQHPCRPGARFSAGASARLPVGRVPCPYCVTSAQAHAWGEGERRAPPMLVSRVSAGQQAYGQVAAAKVAARGFGCSMAARPTGGDGDVRLLGLGWHRVTPAMAHPATRVRNRV